jgi:hypothetical protein
MTVLLVAFAAPAAFAQHVHDPSKDQAPEKAPADDKSGPAKGEPAKSNPLAEAVLARTPEEQANQSGFQFGIGLDHYLGMGTFVDPQQYASFSAMLTVAPTYLFSVGKQKLVASGTFRMAYEYSLPDAETGRRTQVIDTRFGLSAPAVFREPLSKIAVTPSLALTVPTSLESWNAGLITNVSLGVAVTRSFFQALDLRLSVGGSRAFYASAQNATPASSTRDEQGHLIAIGRANEPFVNFTGWNPAWSFSVGGVIQWRATGSILISASYTYAKTWRYNTGLDQFSPAALDALGNRVVRAGGEVDRTIAAVGISYQMNEHYSLDFGLYTLQTPLTPTGQVRFPFLSAGTLADNAASLYLSLSAYY